MNNKYLIVILFFILTISNCTAHRGVRGAYTIQKRGERGVSGKMFSGTCSYYGKKFHGKKTANGEVYDMHKLTAAHKTLPFGTVLEVENLANNKKVVVRINDRGPFVGNRSLDLSFAAAQKIGLIKSGITEFRALIFKRIKAN